MSGVASPRRIELEAVSLREVYYRTHKNGTLREVELIIEANCDRAELFAEIARLEALLNTPEIEDFADGVVREAQHQVYRWGPAQDRKKSAENWFWLVGYLAGKALRAAICGDRNKALHYTISSAAALANWHRAIKADATGSGAGTDADINALVAKRA